MEIVAYTTDGCFYCDQLKRLIKRANLKESTKFIKVGRDMSREEFVSQFPDATGYPLVYIDGERIGGLVEVARVFVREKLVSVERDSGPVLDKN